MKSLDREEAIQYLVDYELKKLTKSDRESMILNWWGINEDDEEYRVLPTQLRTLLIENEYPPENCDGDIFDPLVLAGLSHRYKGVTNKYIQLRVKRDLCLETEITGDEESLLACPCCGYLTLTNRHDFEICPVCSWEDDWVKDENQYSAANRQTLRDAKSKLVIDDESLETIKWRKS